MRQVFSLLQAARGVTALAAVGFHIDITTAAFITPAPALVQSL
jgi:hypothetical protein